jgi:hypothetical protein
MRTLLIILLATSLAWLLPVMALAGSETLRPDGDALIQGGWAKCDSSHFWKCVSDEVQAAYDSMYDNNNIDSVMFFTLENTAISDSTIDSVTIYFEWRNDHVGNLIAICDTVAGAEAPDAYRLSSNFTAALIDVFYVDSITYTTTPAEEAYTWTDIDNYIIGVKDADHANNKQVDITEMWITVWYTAIGGDNISYVRRRVIIQGDQ